MKEPLWLLQKTTITTARVNDVYGRTTSLTRNSGRNSSYTYDNGTINESTVDRFFSKNYGPDGSLIWASDRGGAISYAYYPDRKVKSITAPDGSVTSMQYADAARNQTQMLDPSAGTINYTYNSLGQIKTQTNARNQLTSWNYFADGRINTVVTPEGTTTYTYNSNKQLTGINSPNNVSRSFGYDNKGRVNSVDETIAGTNFSTNFNFDSYGRVNTRTHPSGIVETWGYNGNGFLATISAGGSTRYTVTSMNAREQLTGATYGSNLAATFGVDSYGYPNISSAGSIQDYRYAFNPVTGNLNSRQNFKCSLSESFSYTDNQDNLDRLTSVTGPMNLSMTYAANGNILTKSDINATTMFTYGAGAGPYALTKVTSSTGVIPAISQSATYTSFEKVNSLIEGAYAATLTYNSDNQRAKMMVTQGGSTILTRWYVGSSYLKQTEGSVTKEFTWIGGNAYTAPVLAITQSGITTYYYLLRDHLGSIIINDARQAYGQALFTRQSNFNDPYRYARQTYYGGMTLGLTLYLTDGPGIGPGDAAGAIYQTSTLVTTGLIFAGTYAYLQISDHMSKGGRANIWPDSYPKPNPANINWSYSDSQLATGVTGGGVPTGPGSDWNKIKKWFRDTRRKIKGNFK